MCRWFNSSPSSLKCCQLFYCCLFREVWRNSDISFFFNPRPISSRQTVYHWSLPPTKGRVNPLLPNTLVLFYLLCGFFFFWTITYVNNQTKKQKYETTNRHPIIRQSNHRFLWRKRLHGLLPAHPGAGRAKRENRTVAPLH